MDVAPKVRRRLLLTTVRKKIYFEVSTITIKFLKTTEKSGKTCKPQTEAILVKLMPLNEFQEIAQFEVEAFPDEQFSVSKISLYNGQHVIFDKDLCLVFWISNEMIPNRYFFQLYSYFNIYSWIIVLTKGCSAFDPALSLHTQLPATNFWL